MKIIAVITPFTYTQTFQVFNGAGTQIDSLDIPLSDLNAATAEILALVEKHNISEIHLLGAQCYTGNLGENILTTAKTTTNFSNLTVEYR